MRNVPVVLSSEVGMVALIVVDEITVDVRVVDPNDTLAPAAKFPPESTTFTGPDPTIAVLGEIPLITGGTGITLNATAPDVRDKGDGSTTVIWAVPAPETFAAGTVATSSVAELTTVVSATPFQAASDDGIKFCPVIVSTKDAEPALIEVGEMLEMLGADAVIVNVTAADINESGAASKTATCTWPGTEIFADVTCASSEVPDL